MIESDERRAATNSIAAFFRAMPSPSSVRPEDMESASRRSDISRLVSTRIVDGFQWSTGSEPAKGMEDHVQGLLVDHGFAVDTASARRSTRSPLRVSHALSLATEIKCEQAAKLRRTFKLS